MGVLNKTSLLTEFAGGSWTPVITMGSDGWLVDAPKTCGSKVSALELPVFRTNHIPPPKAKNKAATAARRGTFWRETAFSSCGRQAKIEPRETNGTLYTVLYALRLPNFSHRLLFTTESTKTCRRSLFPALAAGFSNLWFCIPSKFFLVCMLFIYYSTRLEITI